MLADGAHGLHRALLGAHDEERLAGHRDAEVVAGVRDLLDAPDADPGPREDGLALELEELRRGIAAPGEHPCRSAVERRRRQLIEEPLDDRTVRQSTHPVPPGSSLLDLAQTQDLGAAVHVLAHLAAERLEVLARAVRLRGRLIRVALHEDIGARRLPMVVEGVELAARLMGVDLGHQLLGYRLELLLHSLLHLDRGDHSQHLESSWLRYAHA